MARADIYTLLPLDEYARVMAIHPDAFNQCVDPANPYPGQCDRVWLQYGWMDYTTGRIVGRHDVAQAVSTAEEMIASAMSFWPAPRWETADEKRWPRPARGRQWQYPPIQASWGEILAGGQRRLLIIDEDAPVLYSASVAGGTLDTATINITAAQMAVAGASRADVAVYFANQTEDIWRIHYLTITENPVTGDITIVGRRSQFTDPNLWLVDADVDLSVNANFVVEVDVYRRYNDPSQPAQVVWKGGTYPACDITLCADNCQTSCMSVDDHRRGIVRVLPGAYAAGVWSLSAFQVSRLPDAARLWYWNGLPLENNLKIKPAIAEAIVRLANTLLVDEPCGCAQTKYRWDRDREEQDINTYDVALAMSAFGSAMRGAVFAHGVIKRLGPLARGGALT